jgi:diguanylate cyclase (GGDEF)-like protein
MTPDPVSVSETFKVKDVINELHTSNHNALTVTDSSGKTVGLFSVRDVFRQLAVDGPEMLEKPVSTVMKRDLVPVKPSDTLIDAYKVMRRRNYHHVAVVENGKPIGMLSIENFIRFYDAQMDKTYLDAVAKKKEAMNPDVDPLTGCLSAGGVKKAVQKRSQESNLFMAFIDIDFFKTHKLEFGPEKAYDMVVAACNAIPGFFKGKNIQIGRVEQDMLAVIVPGTTHGEVYESLEELRAKIDHEERLHDKNVTISCGFVKITSGENYGNLYKRANKALLTAKGNGRNCVRYLE